MPSSAMTKLVEVSEPRMLTSTERARACLRTLVSDSWTMRMTCTSARGDRDTSWPTSLASRALMPLWVE